MAKAPPPISAFKRRSSSGEPSTLGESSPTGGGRQLTVKVKTAKSRSVASTRWLERQLNDPYVAEAKRLGYRSRAAFKLLQLDARCKLLHPGLRVVDLGAAPGGWTQVVVEKLRLDAAAKGRVVGLDILAMEPIHGADLLQMDFLAPDADRQLMAYIGGRVDVVLSDMAAPTVGHRSTDHLRTMALAEAAWAFASQILAPNGAFVCKLFQGGAERDLLAAIRQLCRTVRHIKPLASRSDSVETYLVAQGFHGPQAR
jgi:23S rRNA (uridine2552-2'-O)-methyltransferase